MQAIVLVGSLQSVAATLPHDGVSLTREIPRVLARTCLMSFALLVPLSLMIGVRSTFGIVGPLYRFRVYLGRIAAGERPGPCRIRKTDDLHDLCDAINRAVEPLQGQASAKSDDLPQRKSA